MRPHGVSADSVVLTWLVRFGAGMEAGDAEAMAGCFAADGYWRDILTRSAGDVVEAFFDFDTDVARSEGVLPEQAR